MSTFAPKPSPLWTGSAIAAWVALFVYDYQTANTAVTIGLLWLAGVAAIRLDRSLNVWTLAIATGFLIPYAEIARQVFGGDILSAGARRRVIIIGFLVGSVSLGLAYAALQLEARLRRGSVPPHRVSWRRANVVVSSIWNTVTERGIAALLLAAACAFWGNGQK